MPHLVQKEGGGDAADITTWHPVYGSKHGGPAGAELGARACGGMHCCCMYGAELGSRACGGMHCCCKYGAELGA